MTNYNVWILSNDQISANIHIFWIGSICGVFLLGLIRLGAKYPIVTKDPIVNPKRWEQLSDVNLSAADLYRMSRCTVQMDKSRLKAKRLPPARRELELRKFGLQILPSPMVHHGLAFDPYRQTALDPDHSELGSHGLGKHLIHLTINIFLSDASRYAFTKTFRNFPFPPTWSRLLNPCTHLLKYRFSDTAHMVSIGAFLLRRFLKLQHISHKMAGNYQTAYPESSRSNLISQLLECWVTMAQTMRLIFQSSFSVDDYQQMNRLIIHSRSLLYDVTITFYRTS
jgi:hypothetical protein